MSYRRISITAAAMGGLVFLLAGGTPAATAGEPAALPPAACPPVQHGQSSCPWHPKVAGQAVVLENEVCRYEIGTDGYNRALVSLADRQDYAQPGAPFMLAGRGAQSFSAAKVELADDVLTVSFAGCPTRVKARVRIRPRYFTLTVTGVSGGELDWLQLCNLRVKTSQHVGSLVNAAWDGRFAACALACNDRTDCGSHGVPTARAYRQFGIEGAKVAILAVPTGGPDPGGRLLDAIEAVELGEGLPHPLVNGVWIKRAPERFASYLMVGGVNQKNVDQVVEFARGGFGCIELFWERSTPTYEPNPGLFPDGLPGLKRVADKIHAAGLQLGLHVMQGMVGWGAKDDPYLVPKADPRLLQDRHVTLVAPLDAKQIEIAVREPTVDWPEKGDLYLDGEIVRYQKLAPHGFAQCQRGLYGTTVASHAAGARAGHLVNCFPIWGFTVYSPDVNSTMVDEICGHIARAFNAVGADMSYFDGGEEIAVQPPHWRNQGRIALGVQARLRKPVILEGNGLYTHLAWHVISRGGPSFDPIYYGRREFTLRMKGQNPAGWAADLLTGDVGWYAAHTHSPVTDAVTPDEIELLCLKALGGKAPISMEIGAGDLGANRRMPEMLAVIRTCEELKRRRYFSESACAELCRPMAEHALVRAADGGWELRPRQFGPAQVVDAARPERSEWTYANPYGEQLPWIRLRARTALAPHGAKGNLVLADPAAGVPFQPDGAASAALVQSVEPSGEKAPDGGTTFCYRAENRTGGPSAWCRATHNFPQPLVLWKHRRLGLWIRTEGQGGILNVQLSATDARRDHYISLQGRRWTYLVLDPPEGARFFDYAWPYPFTDVLYTCAGVYQDVKQCHLYFNGLPPHAKAACWIGRIEALQERSLPLVSPGLESGGRKLVFPVSLQPDEYLELDGAGPARHFDPNGALLGQVATRGSLRLRPGENRLRFSCVSGGSASPRAEVTLAVRGEPLPGARMSNVETGSMVVPEGTAPNKSRLSCSTVPGRGDRE
jgi:hypothetical protein